MSYTPLPAAAEQLVRRLEVLARVTDEPGVLTRTFLSPAMGRANAQVARWMREAGLRVRIDGVGNLIGRIEGATANARTLLLGSHLDTVRDAGSFDGALGVLLPIAALAELRGRGVRLPFAVEVLGFSEEEGVRFSSGYIGSKGYAGRLTAADLSLKDAAGTTLGRVLRDFGGRPFRLPRPAHPRRDLIGYVEVHIEQGPVLESKGLAAGVVTAIAGQTRIRIEWSGRAGHAGTTPMAMRRDALAGAAEFVLAAEEFARRHPPLVATVGMIVAHPGAPNVVPGGASHSLDVRHPENVPRRSALAALRERAAQIARRRRLKLTWKTVQDDGAVACSPRLAGALARSVRKRQGRCPILASGAGHDGVAISRIAPIAMLFVRCRGGLSHHPDEYVDPRDLEVALGVLSDFMEGISHERA